MSSSIENVDSSYESSLPESAPNTVAVIGTVLACASTAMCALMFSMADQMPAEISKFKLLETGSPDQLRLLILGCSTAVLSFVAFVLCLIGLVQPNRPRALASIGTALSGSLLMGVFGTLLLGTLLNARPQVPIQAEKEQENIEAATPDSVSPNE